jgi:hypothetical protein
LEQLARRLAELSPDDRLQVLSLASGVAPAEIWWANPEPAVEVTAEVLERVAEELNHPKPPSAELVEAFRRWGPGR